ncbi:uncharacterized protein M421DRAFT_420586 [Didymella exigua CBS 183.55]|uniref:Uncharacterized protein n=1 Tax=Didymella exigua CBS 183.55 TaxID=1150837 RepID=A0A6A5RQW4_9PLEO|nr:uncharacterized protein M421DRAFT_420586 [Didymella exigua CBS 183.55]KAF1928696.1 hypothetical protein M421DRAFT_420586 [Didymella exigua CBS 183.55]
MLVFQSTAAFSLFSRGALTSAYFYVVDGEETCKATVIVPVGISKPNGLMYAMPYRPFPSSNVFSEDHRRGSCGQLYPPAGSGQNCQIDVR